LSERVAPLRAGAYVDSGVLVKLYVRERNSAAAAQIVTAFPSVKLYPFQELEIRNTLRALAGRTVITDAQRAAAEHEFERDLILGRLQRATPDWRQVFQIAARLSIDHTAATLARSLDILHVAIAIAEQADPFITADRRQHDVAQREGLTTEILE
jgi:predicted nucleic acid-binding protein